MEWTIPDDPTGEWEQPPLPLELQFQLKRVEDQAAQLEEDELRHALLCAWSGWMTERHTVREWARQKAGVNLQVQTQGFLPYECCGVEG
jgi:hypothetical protein